MLQQTEQEAVMPAAEVRVSPEELAQGLLRAQERREAAARQQAETIPLGQAITDLDLDVSPEDILEGVREHRARQTAGATSQSALKRKRRQLTTVLLAGSLAASGFLGVRALRSHPTGPPVAATGPSATQKLAEVAVGQSFRLDNDTLLHLANKKIDANAVVSVTPATAGLWNATRTTSGFQIDAWTSPAGALEFANGQSTGLYSSAAKVDGGNAVAVRAPIERFRTGTVLDPNEVRVETTLSGIPVGKSFSCDRNTLIQMIKGTADPASVVNVYANISAGWSCVRSEKGFDLYATAPEEQFLNLAKGHAAVLYSEAHTFDGVRKVAVHIPISRIKLAGDSQEPADTLTVIRLPYASFTHTPAQIQRLMESAQNSGTAVNFP